MPKSPARIRATLASTAVIGASVAVLLVSPVGVPPAGAVAAPGSTQRVSVKDKDTQSPNGGNSSVISADGRSVAFTSTSQLDNLSNGQNNAVYVRDLVNGRTVMISRGQIPETPPSTGAAPPPVRFGSNPMLDLGAPAKQAAAQAAEFPPNGSSFDPALSADGRYVAFTTFAGNIVDNLGSRMKIVVCDRDPDGNGTFDEDQGGKRNYVCFRASGRTGGTGLSEPKLSADAGRIVWQESSCGDGCFSRLKTAVLKTATGGIGQPPLTGILDVPSEPDNTQLDDQFDPAISGDGNHIVLHATLFPNCDCDEIHAIVSTDMRTGAATRVDIDFNKPISNNFNEFVMRPAVSFDGTVIAFVAEQFFFDDNRGTVSQFDEPNVYVVHVNYGAAPGKQVTDARIQSKNNAGEFINGERPALSADGRYLAFTTDALRSHDGEDLGTVDNSCINPPPPVIGLAGKPMLRLNAALPPERDQPRTVCQVVVRDLIVDQERLVREDSRLPGTLVSPNQAGNAGDRNTIPNRTFWTAPSLTADGGRIAYDSDATNLVGNDTNNQADVFVRTLEPTLSAKAIDFGQVQLGSSLTKTAELTEVGNGPLVIEQFTTIGANAGDFSVGTTTCTGQTLHATGTCLVEAKFTPKAAGNRNGQLLVQIKGGRRFIVDLSGSGTEQPVPKGPTFAAGPDPLNFGSRLLLSSGPASTVTVTNDGESPLKFTSIAIVGPSAPGDYAITGNTCSAADVPGGGGKCTVSVTFSPKLPGSRPAVLRFDDNTGAGPHLVGLQGTGNQPTIEVNPGVTPPGRVVTVTGKDFPPGKTVTVKFDGRIGQSTVTAGSDGTFRVALLIFPKATPENRTVLATVDGFTDPLAKAPLLIVFPTVSPADFVVRG